jgi:ubiquinone/menaquinone biosynthesis C-methylase UbiE
MTIDIERLYGEFWGGDQSDVQALVRTSLQPRDMDMLYDLFARTGCGPDDLVLDVGARDARYAVELARRHGCRVVAIDPIPLHIERARDLIERGGMTGRVEARLAGIEALPLDDGSVDHIWCRDMLNHVDLPAGIGECARVLRPGGSMLVYQTFAGPHLEPVEAARLYAGLSIVPENMAHAVFERTVREAGFVIEIKDVIASEWRERWVEDGDHGAVDDLLEIARLRRAEDQIVARIGRDRYETELSGRLWGVFQLLGKLLPTAYLLRKPAL